MSLSDPLAAYADAVIPRHIVGDYLALHQGRLSSPVLRGDLVPVGTNFTVAADELLAGWIKWTDGKPVEHIMVRVADGSRRRSAVISATTIVRLGKPTINGKPRDPWQFTNYLPMMNENG